MWRFDIVQVWIGLFMLGWKVFNIKKLLKYALPKAPHQKKGNRAIVENTHFNSMCVAYNHHLAIYSRKMSKNTQLIPNVVSKALYATFKTNYPKS